MSKKTFIRLLEIRLAANKQLLTEHEFSSREKILLEGMMMEERSLIATLKGPPKFTASSVRRED